MLRVFTCVLAFKKGILSLPGAFTTHTTLHPIIYSSIVELLTARGARYGVEKAEHGEFGACH